MAQPFFGHVERHLGIEDPHVEREQAIHVVGEEGDVVSAVDEHGRRVVDLSVVHRVLLLSGEG